MREVQGNIWDYREGGHWVVITTNGTIRKDGACVMGRGIALQAAKRVIQLPLMLGTCIKAHGNKLFTFLTLRIVAFPVKTHWKSPADLRLIEKSTKELADFVSREGIGEIYMVRPGCGNGGLDWKDVKPVLERYLDDRFIVVEKGGLKSDRHSPKRSGSP